MTPAAQPSPDQADASSEDEMMLPGTGETLTGDVDRFAWRARIRANPQAHFWYRIGVAIAGALLIILAGLTGWLPGPGGIPLALLGLAVLASEFAWAHRLTSWFLRWVHRYQELSKRARVGIVLGALGIGLACWYVSLVIAGTPQWLPDGVESFLDRLPGV